MEPLLTTTPTIHAEDVTTRALPRPTKRQWWALGALTAALLAVVTFWATLTPLYDAPDEPLHMNSAIRLAQGGGWPEPGDAEVSNMVLAARGEAGIPAADRSTFTELLAANPGYNGVDQMTQHPPLYYMYVAAVLSAADFMDIRSDHALLLARLAGLLFVLPLPFVAWDSIRRLTRSSRAGLVAAASLLAVPQLAHIMGSVSNDSMAIAFSSIVIWLGVRVMTGDRSWWTTVGIGLALAAALLSKGTAVPLVAYVAFVMVLWPRGLALGQRMLRAFVSLAAGFLGGWWWAKNLLVYGTLQPAGLVYDANPWPEGSGPSVGYFIDQLWLRVPTSFWGNFGWLTHPLPTYVTHFLTVICLAVVVFYAFRRSTARTPMLAMAAVTFVFVIALVYQTWPSYVRSQLPAGMQGRYFFVVLIALIALSAVGWRNLIVAAERTRACIGLLVVFAAIAALGIVVEFRAVYTSVNDWLLRAPLGTVGTAALLLATAAICVTAFVLAVREVRRSPATEVAALDAATV